MTKPKRYGSNEPSDVPGSDLAYVRTGEFRAPKAGEWYLSGAIPQAYRAPNDLSTAYHILRAAGEHQEEPGRKRGRGAFVKSLKGPDK